MPLMEKILKIGLNELNIVRLRCNRSDCNGVAEMPLARLNAVTGGINCPSCGHQFTAAPVGSFPVLKALASVIQSLSAEKGFSVEFVVPSAI